MRKGKLFRTKYKRVDTHFAHPPLLSDPGGIQTHDLQNRNLTFYSAELRGLISPAKVVLFSGKRRVYSN